MARKFFSGLFGKKQSEANHEIDENVADENFSSEKNHARDHGTSETPPKDTPSETKPADAVDNSEPETLNSASTGDQPEVPQAEIKPTPEEIREEEIQQKPEEKKAGFFSRLKAGLSKTSNQLTDGVTSIFTKKKLDDEMLEELENLLITADLGVDAATRFTTNLAKSKFDKEVSDEEVRNALAEDVAGALRVVEKPLSIDVTKKPHVILMTGVNGAGKTTTIGKLAAKFKQEGLSVMLAAGDTFRAAAIEQLTVWGERTNTPVIKREVGADAAGLAYDALKEAHAQNIDVLLIDTAGRLQNKTELMDELAKIIRVVKKVDESAPHDSILVLDATVGQNAISQLQAFKQTANISGIIMTKLDGTARGGVLVALSDKFSVPVHYVGIGESTEDLQPFNADDFARALAGV